MAYPSQNKKRETEREGWHIQEFIILAHGWRQQNLASSWRVWHSGTHPTVFLHPRNPSNSSTYHPKHTYHSIEEDFLLDLVAAAATFCKTRHVRLRQLVITSSDRLAYVNILQYLINIPNGYTKEVAGQGTCWVINRKVGTVAHHVLCAERFWE